VAPPSPPSPRVARQAPGQPASAIRSGVRCCCFAWRALVWLARLAESSVLFCGQLRTPLLRSDFAIIANNVKVHRNDVALNFVLEPFPSSTSSMAT